MAMGEDLCNHRAEPAGACNAVEDLRRRLGRKTRTACAPVPLPAPSKKALCPDGHTPNLPPGREQRSADGMSLYVLEQRVAERQPDLSGAFSKTLSTPGSGLWVELSRLGLAGRLSPADLVFLDLETTGLNCAPVFLLGVLLWESDGLVVRQFFARNYAEERAVLSRSLELLSASKLWVSFNGKSFDLPFLRTRAAAAGLPWELERPHLDLLHAARRAWKGRWPDCRLQTLERRLCGRARKDDIPGAEIPDAYHAFVRTGNAASMAAVLRHNRQDLVTLAELLVRLPPPPDTALLAGLPRGP